MHGAKKIGGSASVLRVSTNGSSNLRARGKRASAAQGGCSRGSINVSEAAAYHSAEAASAAAMVASNQSAAAQDALFYIRSQLQALLDGQAELQSSLTEHLERWEDGQMQRETQLSKLCTEQTSFKMRLEEFLQERVSIFEAPSTQPQHRATRPMPPPQVKEEFIEEEEEEEDLPLRTAPLSAALRGSIGHGLGILPSVQEVPTRAAAPLPKGLSRRWTPDLSDFVVSQRSNGSKVWRTPTHDSRSGAKDTESSIERLVKNDIFNIFWGAVVMINILLIGIEVEYSATHDTSPLFFELAQLVFNIGYTVELALRIQADGWKFFKCPGSVWNWVDSVIVVFSVLELLFIAVRLLSIVEIGGAGEKESLATQLLRFMRLARLFRILRIFRFCAPMRIMCQAIASSAQSLIWAIVLLCGLWYALAVCFTTAAVWFVKSENIGPRADHVKDRWHSLFTSSYYLLAAVCGGISWVELVEDLAPIGWWVVALFLLYIALTYFSILNVITASVVENAIVRSQHERDMVVQRELHVREAYAKNLEDLFLEADKDCSGTLTEDEFTNRLADTNVQAYLTGLRIDASDGQRLFNTLAHGESELSIEEFVDSCLQLQGDATRQDVSNLLYEQKRQLNKLRDFMAGTEASLRHLSLDVRSSVQAMQIAPQVAQVQPNQEPACMSAMIQTLDALPVMSPATDVPAADVLAADALAPDTPAAQGAVESKPGTTKKRLSVGTRRVQQGSSSRNRRSTASISSPRAEGPDLRRERSITGGESVGDSCPLSPHTDAAETPEAVASTRQSHLRPNQSSSSRSRGNESSPSGGSNPAVAETESQLEDSRDRE